MIAVNLVNRILSAVLAVLLLAVGVLVVVEVVRAVVDAGPVTPWTDVSRWLAENTWAGGAARSVLVVIALLGLLLLVVGLWPNRMGGVRFRSSVPGLTATATRRSLARYLAAAAEDQDGVASASAVVKRRAIAVDARTRLHAPEGVRQAVTEAVQARVADLDLEAAPRPTVRVSQERS